MASLVSNIWDSLHGGKEQTPAMMERASEFIRWSDHKAHQDFLDWLYDQADMPINTSLPHGDLIAGNARCNTMKEIRRYLIDEETKARRLIDRENNG